ncbi:hypothetical protein Q5P01_017074 [Channa striata]|uniref:Meiosis-specific coiled-coil domain-containing protein MEIOC n=1 Tax=Channa striata TaxID=64152 RepID=A0AA88M9C5_CHASR|nr:hypothetical protein Q5P01_017074 [Channa striata]
MDFDGHQSTLANAFFPKYQGQLSLNAGGGNNGSGTLPFVSLPNDLLQDTASHMSWPHNAYDDPYEGVSSTQSSIKIRKSDNTDCDGETDLQGLVSNILDEAHSQDSYYREGTLPTFNSIWSPKTLREELLQYLQSESKVQHSSTFPANTFSKTQGQSIVRDIEEICQYSSSVGTNQQLLFHLPNGDRDSYTPYPQKLSPGEPVPNIVNTYLPPRQQSKYENVSFDKDRESAHLMNNLPDLSNVFSCQSKMNSPSVDPCYEDCYTQNITRPKNIELPVPQDINQLVSSFQSFMAVEHDSFHCRDFPDMNKQLQGMHHEEQWQFTIPPLSAQKTPAIQTPKQLLGEFGTVQRKKNEEVGKQIFKHDAFRDLPCFNPQNTEYFQQPKPSSAYLKHPKQYQNNMTMHRENININTNQYSKHCTQERQVQSEVKPQLFKDKKMMDMSGFLGDGFSGIPLPNTLAREEDKKPALSQPLYFALRGSMQPQKFDGENSIVSTGNTHQIMPPIYNVNDPRRYCSIPINSRSMLPYRNGVPGLDVGDMVPANESAHCSSCVSDMMTQRGEGTYSMASVFTTPMVMNQGGPMVQLYPFVNECYEQWRCLEKERKKTEVILTKTFPGKQTAAVFSSYQLKPPPNATRVDHLIVKQIREKAKVASLLDRMEYLNNNPLHVNIHTALNRHHMAICKTQARRKEEIANMSKRQQNRTHCSEDRDTLLLVFALKDLVATTRKLRTALWCALQMTLPKPVDNQAHFVEATCSETCSSPFEGYSFRL